MSIAWGKRAMHSGKYELLLVAKAADRNGELRDFAVTGIHSVKLIQSG